MRRDLLCAAVAAFLLLFGGRVCVPERPGTARPEPGATIAAVPAGSGARFCIGIRGKRRVRTGCDGSGTFIAVHCCESSGADNRSPGSSGTQGARTEERSGGRKAAKSFHQRQYSNAGRRLRGRPKSLGGRG